MTLAYEAGAAAESISPLSGSSTWNPDTFFGNSDPTNCPITSCSIYDKDSCGTGSFSGSSDVTFSISSITASRVNTAIAGYSYDACIRCENQSQQIDLNGWKIEQTSRCANTLSPGVTPSAVSLVYSAAAADE